MAVLIQIIYLNFVSILLMSNADYSYFDSALIRKDVLHYVILT